MDRKDKRRWVFGAVPESVLADLVWLVVMRPKHIGDRRVAVHDLQADAVALLELEGVRLDADVETIDLARLQRLGLRMREVRLHLGRALRVRRAMRGAQPALGHDLEVRIQPL